MEKNEMLTKEKMQATLSTVVSQYLNDFLNRNHSNKVTEELVVGLGQKIILKLTPALEPWIPKKED